MMIAYDVVTLGETMIRLSPPGMARIEAAHSFEIVIGGSESNTAVGIARLGGQVCWLSRLTDNALGRSITGALAHHGVDTARVTWTDADRVGVYFYEPAPAPRGGRVIYDRAGSALSRMTPADLPIDLFQPGAARLLHLTGITPAVGAGAVAATARDLAKRAGWRLSFDVNYRSKLWSPADALAGCLPYMAMADLVLIGYGDAQTFYGVTGVTTPDAALDRVAQDAPTALVVMTLGADGAIARLPDGSIVAQAAFPSQEVGRLGGGDAFAAGFLYRWLQDDAPTAASIGEALRWGTACAALKYGMPGDMPIIDRADVLALVEGDAGGLRR
ncbi:MAG: sugar kinase [Chloroflexota bacterium]|nr:sugar kinase [Chloroflexota bacterium]